jgi:hypothetical protein
MKGIAHIIGAAIYALTGISAEKGAETTLYVATSPEIEGESGKYFSQSKGGKETSSSRLSYDVAVRQRLWEVSEELIQQNQHSQVVSRK